MFDIVNLFGETSNQWINIFLLILAMARIYLEVINFKFSELPLTKKVFPDGVSANDFHRKGLYISVGYVLFWAPFVLFS